MARHSLDAQLLLPSCGWDERLAVVPRRPRGAMGSRYQGHQQSMVAEMVKVSIGIGNRSCFHMFPLFHLVNKSGITTTSLGIVAPKSPILMGPNH